MIIRRVRWFSGFGFAWGLPKPRNSEELPVPETNSEFAPENGWLEDDRFLLG